MHIRHKKQIVILKGRKVIGGMVEGSALVCDKSIHTHGIDPRTGIINEMGHPLQNLSIKGQVLVFPSPKGQSDWGRIFYDTCRRGNAPLAIINRRATTLVLNGVIASSTPMVVDLDKDPCRAIETGDWVKVDADHGIVEVHKKRPG